MRRHKLHRDFIRKRQLSWITSIFNVQIHVFLLKLFQKCILPFKISIVQWRWPWTILWIDLLLTVIKKELNALHVVLEFAVAQILDARSGEWQIQFFDGILEHFDIALILRLVSCIEIQLMKLNNILVARLDVVKDLAISDAIRQILYFRVICIHNVINPREQLQPAQILCFHIAILLFQFNLIFSLLNLDFIN